MTLLTSASKCTQSAEAGDRSGSVHACSHPPVTGTVLRSLRRLGEREKALGRVLPLYSFPGGPFLRIH